MVLITTTYGFSDGSMHQFFSGYANEAQAIRCLTKAASEYGVSKIVWGEKLPASATHRDRELVFIRFNCQKGACDK
jgi:hypothetical protein